MLQLVQACLYRLRTFARIVVSGLGHHWRLAAWDVETAPFYETFVNSSLETRPIYAPLQTSESADTRNEPVVRARYEVSLLMFSFWK